MAQPPSELDLDLPEQPPETPEMDPGAASTTGVAVSEPAPETRAKPEYVYDILTHLALHGRETLTDELLFSFAIRHEIPMAEQVIPIRDGDVRPLGEVLAMEAPPPRAADAVSALFAEGYAARLAPLDISERRNLTLRLMATLPGVESIGPYVLTDHVDVVCDGEDALRFWQIYVDRISAELNRRAPPEVEPTASPWLLGRLLDHHHRPTIEQLGLPWPALAVHVSRIAEAGRRRWRLVHHLVESCHDLRVLYYLCRAPAMVETTEIVPVFLSRGSSKLVSCALFTLCVYRSSASLVDRALYELGQRPFRDIAPRIVEIYGQIGLADHPGSALRRLARGLIDLCKEHLRHSSIEPLIDAVANDARSFRQCCFFVDLMDEGEDAIERGRAIRLLRRVLFSFFQSFTPSGLDHAYNDEVWKQVVERALQRLVELESPDLEERLLSFGLGLDEQARRWIKGADDAARARWSKLTGRFVGTYAEVLRGVCAALYAVAETREAGLRFYGILLQVFGAHERIAVGSGRFGMAEYMAAGRSTSPDVMDAMIDEDTGVGGADSKALAVTIAEAEALFWPPEPLRTLGSGADTADLAPPLPLRVGAPPALLRDRPSRDAPARAPVRLATRSSGVLASVLRVYTGLELLVGLVRGAMRLAGIRRAHELVLTDREMLVTTQWTLWGRVIRSVQWGHAVDDLVDLRVVRQMRLFYLAVGLGALIAGGVVGGHLIFAGLRAVEVRLLGLGGGVLCLGVVIDALMTRLATLHRRMLHVELRFCQQPRRLRFLADVAHITPVLNAFMTIQSERNADDEMSWTRRKINWAELDTDALERGPGNDHSPEAA